MASIRSLLWIGRGATFSAEIAADAPTLDVVVERDLDAALGLPLEAFDAVVLDLPEAGAPDAADALSKLRARPDAPPVLARVAREELDRARALLEAGAADVVARGGDEPGGGESVALAQRIERLAARSAPPPRRPPAPRRRATPSASIVGASPAMREVFALVERASRSGATVIVTGETGTGKELLARAIHEGSERHRRAFVAVNCAAFPDTLLESELFGHVRGAFTGADRDKRGLVEAADGGTLFLDEVGETSGPFQAKLLRVLQEREVRPVGGARARPVDVRVVSATHRDLWRDTRALRFREDLYFRLAVFPIPVPPLRERPADVGPLAEHFLAVYGRRERKPGVTLDADALRLLRAYHWPGNVRELENEIQRALALAEPGETLTPAHFSTRLTEILDPVPATVEPGETLRETLGRVEAWLIRAALEKNGYRRADTARLLGVTREGLYKKMKRLGIE